MQPMTVTGSLGRDAELKQTQGGESILSFSVASTQGFKEDKKTNWFRCTLWGKRGVSIASYLTKGTKVTVHGALSIGEYNGKVQHDIRVYEVEWQRNDAARAADTPNDSWDDTNVDDDVPF